MEETITGPVTGADLSDVGALMLPWTADPWGRLRPPVAQEALRLSAEMAAGCQRLNIIAALLPLLAVLRTRSLC